MVHHLTEAQWVDRFLHRLGELMPSIHPAGTSDRAYQAYVDAGDLGPEEAAEAFLRDRPRDEPGASGFET